MNVRDAILIMIAIHVLIINKSVWANVCVKERLQLQVIGVFLALWLFQIFDFRMI